MPPTTLSSALARLERRGYVQRSPNPDDGRSHLLELTAEGDRAWRERWPALGEALGELEARLGGSLDAVVAAIEELQAAARAVLSADVDATTRSQ
jgi:DNA-binding MarR family transcriptional regulator